MPTPLSRTVTTQPSLPRRAETATRGGASPRNFTALPTRFCSTRRSWRGSPSTSGSAPTSSVAPPLVQAGPQVGGHVAHDVVEGHALALQLARARVGEDAVDQLARALGAVAQQPQDLGDGGSSARRSSSVTRCAIPVIGSRRSWATMSA